MQPRSLVGREDTREPVFPARKNSLCLAQIDGAPIRQFIIDLSENWTDFLILVRGQVHLRPPAVRGVAKPPQRIALTPHFVLGRTHDQKCAGNRARNKACENEKSDFPSTCGVHA